MTREGSKVSPALRALVALVALVMGVVAFGLLAVRVGEAAPAAAPLGAAASDSFAVAGGSGNQVWPRIADDTVVYDNCTSSGCRIMLTDLSGESGNKKAISPAGASAYMPATDGKRVVWVDARKATGASSLYDPSANFNIMGADIATGKVFTVTTAAKSQIYPEISGDIVVWTDFRNAKNASDTASGDIYMYNIKTGKETLVTNAKGLQMMPVTNGKVVVWTDYRNDPKPGGYNSDIYGYDIATKKEFVIAKTGATQFYPAISGNIVVWADWRNNEGDIYGYNLSTKKEFVVSAAPGIQSMPTISGNLVVWSDYRNEPLADKGPNIDVYGSTLDTRQEFPVFVGEGTQGAPRIGGTNVVWENNPTGDFEQGDWDVAGATIDPEATPEPQPTEEATAEPTPDDGDNGNGNGPLPIPTVRPSGEAEPGIIKGRVMDAKLKGLADVPITIYGSSLAGERVNFNTRTDAKGYYTQRVPDGIYRIYGYTRVEYKGRVYRLPVWPVDGIDGISRYSKDGVVKDFVWRISGPTPYAKDEPNQVGNYYGGWVTLGNTYEFELMHGDGQLHSYDFPQGSTIELTLKPNGPLMDGSNGRSIVYKIPPDELGDWVLWDIPLGDYTASAKLIESDGSKVALHVSSISTNNGGQKLTEHDTTPVVFEPMSDSGMFGVELYILP